jgi:hypothetical protein
VIWKNFFDLLALLRGSAKSESENGVISESGVATAIALDLALWQAGWLCGCPRKRGRHS